MQPDFVVVVLAVVVFKFPIDMCILDKTKQNKNKNRHTHDSFLVQSPKEAELLGLEWGILQVSNIIFSDEDSSVRCQYSKLKLEKMGCLT